MAETSKSKPTESPAPGRVSSDVPDVPSDAVVEPSQQQIHDLVREEQEKGFRGQAADPTPNEHYTVAGVLDPNRHVPEEFKTQTGVTVWPEDVVKASSKK